MNNISMALLGAIFLLTGCTSVTVDQVRLEESGIDPTHETIVVMGRHHSPEFETEPSLVSCIGRKLQRQISGLNVIGEQQFQDTLYPWFEPRTAPLNMDRFLGVLNEPLISDVLKENNLRYIVWIEGATEQVNSGGSLSCAIGPGGGGCFGFGTWEDESRYEASIWDYENQREVGRISTDASGTSYMPAIVIPIPMLARVQANACEGMGRQLGEFLQPANEG